MSVVTVVETLWPLPMQLCVSVAADRRNLTEAAERKEVLVVMVPEMHWPLPMQLSTSVAADGRSLTDRGDGGGTADGSVGGDGGGDTLATADAAVCVGGSRQTELNGRGCGRRMELTDQGDRGGAADGIVLRKRCSGHCQCSCLCQW